MGYRGPSMMTGPGGAPYRGPQMPGMVRPGFPQGDRKRDWSPHAGSRAIKQALLSGQSGVQPAEAAEEDKKSERSKSSRSSRKSSSSSSSRRKKKKKSKK